MLTATPLYWDPSGATSLSSVTGGSGTWNLTTKEWLDGNTGQVIAWSNSGDSNGLFNAVFHAGSGTVSINLRTQNSSIDLVGLSFPASSYTLTGASGLQFGTSGQISVATGGSAMLETGIADPQGLTISGGGSLNLYAIDGSTLTGAGSLTEAGPGTTTLSTSNTYSGGTSITGGTLVVLTSYSLAAGSVTISNNGDMLLENAVYLDNNVSLLAAAPGGSGFPTLEGTNGGGVIGDEVSVSNPSNISGAGAVFQSDSGTLGFAGGNVTSSSVPMTLYLQGVGQEAGEAFSNSSHVQIVKNGAGTWSYGGTFGGGTTIDGGTLEVAGSLGTGAISMAAGTTLVNSGTLSDAISLATGTETISGGTLTGSVSGSGSLVVDGSGLDLSGSNIYSGGTTVQAGTLTVTNTAGSGTGPGSVTVASSATLEGNGAISGSVTVDGGGVLTPGFYGTGQLTVGNLALESESNFNIVLNSSIPGSGFDPVNVAGTVSLNGSYLDLSGTRATHAGDRIVIINNQGNAQVGGIFNDLPEGSHITVNGVTYSISYRGGPNDNSVVLTDITPPALVIEGASSADEGDSMTYMAGGTAVNNVEWTVEEGGSQYASGAGGQFTFNPSVAGSYTVCATGYDSHGYAATSQLVLTVSHLPTTVTISGPSTGYVGKSLVFGAQVAQAAGVQDPLTYTWALENSYGTAITNQGINDNNLSTYVVSGSLQPGEYQVSLTVGDEQGGSVVNSSQTFSFSVFADPGSSAFSWGTAAAASLLTTNSYEGNGETQDGEAYSIESQTQATVVQPDGKILLAGYAEPSAGDENASLGANPSSSTSWGWIAQFNQDDSPDTTFGSSQTGVVPVDFTASPANPTGITATQSGIMAMALNPVNGDVVVVGYCYTDSSEVEQDGFGDQLPSLGVAEYLTSPTVINNQIFAAGQPDPNFNGGYPVLFSSADTASVGTQVTVLTSSGVAGDILIGGTEATVGITSGSQPAYAVPDFMLMRLLPNGQLDTTFNGTGVAQQPDVTLLPAYAPFSAWSPNLDLVNYLSEASGLSADTTFITTVEGWQAAVHSLSILSNGNILLAGDAGRASNYEDYPAWIPDVGMTLVEYDPNGTLADGFGTAGVSFISSGQFDSYDGEPEPIGQAVAIAVEQTADNGFLIAGFAGPSVTDDTAAHVVFAEINANGDLDTSYFGSGIYNDDSLLYQSSDSVMYDTSEFFGYGGGWGIGSYNRWNGVFGNLVSSFQLNSEMTMADGSLFYSSSFYSTQTQYQSTNGFEWDIDEVNPETGLLVPGFGNDGVLEVPAQEMNAGVGGSTFDADVQHSTLVVDGDELLMGGVSGQPYFDPIQGAPLNPAWNISDPHPLIISYQTNVQASVSNLVPLATAKGTVQLTWTNTGSGEDGFEILRATNPSDLTPELGTILGSVGADQDDFTDATISPNTVYYYAVIPFYTNPQGQQYGTSSSIAKVTTPPATDDEYALQETLEVPMNGTDVTSVLPLLSGQTYLIVASESVSLGNGYAGDASYWYSTSDPQIYGTTIQGANIGLELGTAGGLSFPQWGPVSANHTYTLVYIGAGNSLSFQYDAPTASTSLSANVIDVEIYTLQLPEIQPPTPPSSSGNQPSLLISVPGLDTDAEPGILSAESAIDVQADLNGSSVPWDLSLTGPSSFSEILASSGSSSSSVTTGLAQVASLLPSLFQGGVYTLSLATTYLSSTNYSTQLSISIQPPVVEILSPATLSNVIPTVSSNTPIDILVADAQGTNVPWQLTLVPASGSSTVLASGAGSAGYLPGSGVQVATLDPALFPNGAYTLELSTTYTDGNANITYDQPISIDTIAKIGNFSLPVTDATLSTVIGPLSISRTYDTNLVNSTSIIPGFGPGWSFDLLNSQLTVIGENDTLNLSQTTPILRAGDLVSMMAPNGSKYVFEFDPVPFYQQNAYASTPDSIQYLPYFLPLDGSGATLTLPASYSFTPYGLPDAETPLAYDAASNEYVRATYGPDFGYKDLGFNPGGLGFHGEYYLTTSAGISYIIYAGTGQIASISDKNGETITFARVTNSDFSSTITATTATGTSVLTIDVSPSNLITQIQIPGQNSIDYNYTNGELTSVVNQTGDTTLYAYQYAGNVDFLTSIANDQGQVILQAQYDPSTELLDGLITASGISVPVSSSALGPNDAMQTVVDAAGNITEDVYDEKTGILLRAIQVLQDSSGDITGYIVDPMSYSYVIDESGQMSSLRSSGAEVLQQVDSFNSFEVSGADPSGLRYSEQPAAASLEKHVEFDTSNDPDDPARGQIVSSSEQVNATGTLQTTLYQNFLLADFQTASYEPQQVTTEVQTPDIASATGYDSYIQTQTFSVYDTADSNGNLLEVLKVVARDLSPATDQQPTELSQTKVFSDVAEGGYPLMLYAVLSGFSVNADNAVQTLQWNAAMAAYVWSDSSGTDTVEIKLQDTSEASDSGTSKAADDWTLTVEDTGSSGSDGVIGTLAGVSFDGTVADFSSLLDQLFSSPSHFQDATTLTTFSSLPQFSAAVPDWVAEGTEYTYSSNANDNLPAGLLLSTQAVTALINADGSIVPGSTAAVSSQDLSQNTYYDASDYSGDTPDAGASYGQVMYSFNSAGQETYYAYDQSGRVILQYTYEQWTGSNGQPVDGWVGTTNVYNSGGQLTDTYSATYVDNAADAQQADHILPVIQTSSESSNSYSYTAVPIFDIDTNQTDSNAVTEYLGQAPLHTVHNDYNTLGQLADSFDVYGGETVYAYDADGNKIRTQYPNGTESISIYNSDNRVIWSTNAFSSTGPADFIVGTYTDYNALGEIIETQTYEGTVITIGTAQSGSATVNVATLASAGTLISTSTSVYDAAGHVIETINPNGLITGSIYYPNGQVEYSGILNAAISESNGVASADLSLSQFAQMNVNGVMENTYTQNIYDQYDPAYGLYYSTSVDQLGNPTKTYSNSLGQIVRTVYADNSFTETLYGVGSVAVSSDQEGDAISDPAGTSMRADLSAKGGYEEVTIAQRNLGDAPVVTYDLYNVAGELTDVWQPAVTDADPTSPTYGQLVQPHWTYVYDTAGSEVVQISPVEQVAFLSWTEDGNTPASFTGGTSFGYDQYGNLVSKQLPDGELQTWSYDQYQENVSHKVYSATNHTMALQTTLDIYNTSAAYGGRLQTEDRYSTDQAVGSTVTPNEQTIYTYDDSPIDQGYMLAVQDYLLQGGTLQLSDFTNYTYDPITGNEASITTADGTINYVYDSTTGLLTETWTGTNHSSPQNDVLYGYTNLGQLASVTQMVLNGTTTSTSGSYVLYDALGNQHSTDRPTTVYTYDAAGNLVTVSDPNGDTTAYTYNNINELTGEVVTDTITSEPIFNEQTAWYDDGQKQDVVDSRYNTNGSVFSQITYNWTYDNDNRLTGEILTVQTGSGSSVPSPYADIFSYDLDNNRTLETEAPAAGDTPTETISYTYNGDDQLVTQIGSGTNNYAISNQYDANGNLWNSANTSGGSTVTSVYGYDLRNRMTSADINGTTSNYTYDWNGVLTSETTGGSTTYYLNDPNNPTGYSKAIQESTTLGGGPTRSYVLGLSVIAQSDATNGMLYMITDGGGSTRALTMSTGAVATGQTFDYDASGNALDFNPSNARTSWLFGGDGRYDQATGFTYHLARWTNGFSFTQMDTVAGQLGNPLTLQSYLLDDANPIMGFDPSGHDDLGDDDGEDDDGSLSDQAFAQVAGAQVEDIAGLSAVNNYVTSNFGSAVAYGQAGFAVGEFAANTLGLDLQAMTAPIGMLAGVALGGAIELASGGLDAVNGLLSELTSAESTGNAEEMEEIIDEVDAVGASSATATDRDLYAFGNASGPRGARPSDFGVTGGASTVGPESPPLPNGASSFGDPSKSGLSGPYFRLPAGTPLPEGISVVPDGIDVLPDSPNPETHNTFFPTEPMTLDEFNEIFKGLGWVRAGKL